MGGYRWAIRVMLCGSALIMLQGPVWSDESYGSRESRAAHGKRERGSGHMSRGMAGYFTGAGHYLRHLLRHQDAIGLTDEQVKRLKTIQLDLDKTRIRTEAEIMVAERELAVLVEDEKADVSAIEAKLKQSEELETNLRMAAIKAKRAAVGLLNPDQLKKDQLEHDKMMHEHMGTAPDRGRHHGRATAEKLGDGHPMKP
jgi:protein CpxP